MRTRTAFNPMPSPRLSKPPASEFAGGGPGVPAPNPHTSVIPALVFDETGQFRNVGAVVAALKAAVESLAGQRGDPTNRAVIFQDLVDYGVMSPDAIVSPHGEVASAEFRLPRQPRRRRSI